MEERKRELRWMRLDNAALIFPASLRKHWSNAFRISLSFPDPVDPALLQLALDHVAPRFPSICVRLRRSAFWYYLEESDKKAVVRRDDLPACHSIYSPGRKNLLYRVNYFGKRVNLEMYHVLTDGTGALVFFRRMITYYLILSHPELGDADDSDLLEKYEENVGDAFDHYYTKGRGLAQLRTMSFNWAFRLRGAKDPNMENHLVEGVISSADFVRLAHQYNTTVGVLSVALYIEAIMDDMNLRERARKKITISVPVNLRQFFPSDTNRNFFGVITISYLTKDYTGELESIIDCVRKAFEYQLSQERVTKTMSSYSALEHNVPIKVVPLVLKDLVVQGFATASQMGVTCSVSNLGRIAMPDQLAPYINYFSAFTTAPSAQITIATYRDKMTFGWASAITTHQVMRAFYRKLAERGIEAVVATNDHDAETIVQ